MSRSPIMLIVVQPGRRKEPGERAETKMTDPDDFSPTLPPHRRDVHGVFITKGSQVSIPPGGFRVFLNAEGSLDSTIELHLGLSMCPIWCQAAVQLVIAARECRVGTLEAWHTSSDDIFSKALISESMISMQATVAAATAIDALYASIKDRYVLPEPLVAVWRRNRTARFKQVAELLRRALDVKPRQAVLLRRGLRHIYQFRDWSVHPPAVARRPLRHPTFESVMEWRLATFTYQNAREMVRAGLSIARQVAIKGKNGRDPIRSYCIGLFDLLKEPVEHWSSHLGELEPQKPDPA